MNTLACLLILGLVLAGLLLDDARHYKTGKLHIRNISFKPFGRKEHISFMKMQDKIAKCDRLESKRKKTLYTIKRNPVTGRFERAK